MASTSDPVPSEPKISSESTDPASDGLKSVKTFFSSQPLFPDLKATDGHKIPTAEFLTASKGIVSFVNLLGSAFSPVSKDIKGNIDKLTKILIVNPDQFKYLSDILEDEKVKIPEGELKIGTDALLWLTRAIQYVCLFLVLLCQDYESNVKKPDLSAYLCTAYNTTLKKHHNWFVQKLFSVCLYAAPDRNSLVRMLVLSPVGHTKTDDKNRNDTMTDEDFLFFEMKQYVDLMKSNIETIVSLYKSHGIEC